MLPLNEKAAGGNLAASSSEHINCNAQQGNPQEENSALDTITVLTCHDSGATAAKTFTVLENSTVQKCDYNAKMRFKYEEIPVSSLDDLYCVLTKLESEHDKFIIRGERKKDAGDVVRRKTHGEDAAFNPKGHRWVTLDVDKIEFPDHLDPVTNPEAVIKWLIGWLPEPFRKASCVYKFSSSQSVPAKVGDAPEKVVSVHLYFWCDRAVSDDEWKRYFKENPCE